MCSFNVDIDCVINTLEGDAAVSCEDAANYVQETTRVDCDDLPTQMVLRFNGKICDGSNIEEQKENCALGVCTCAGYDTEVELPEDGILEGSVYIVAVSADNPEEV